MKTRISKSRVALAALLSLATAAAALALSVAPALAMGFSTLRIPQHGFAAPVQGAGSGSVSWVGVLVVVAILAATVALGVIGWRHDRRSLVRVESPADGHANLPSASKPLPTRTAVGVRARRADDQKRNKHL